MKNTIRSLVAFAAIGAFTLAARAEPPVKIAVVDMAKCLDNFYKNQEQVAKLQADSQKAQQDAEGMVKQRDALVEEYKNLQEQTNNPAASADAKSKAQSDAQKKGTEIQQQQNKIETFVQNTRQSLQQRFNNLRSLMLEEIRNKAIDVAKRHDVTILVDKSGPSALGIAPLVYSDPAYDLTDEIMTEINKDRPASSTPAVGTGSTAAPTSATSTGSESSQSPTINLPLSPKQ